MALLEEQKKIAKKKGFYALGAGILSVIFLATESWIIGIGGLGLTGYLTYKWFKYRAQWGLRF